MATKKTTAVQVKEEGFLKKLFSRKFILSLIVCGVGATALFFEKISGTQFVTLAGLLLGLYGASNVLDKKEQK